MMGLTCALLVFILAFISVLTKLGVGSAPGKGDWNSWATGKQNNCNVHCAKKWSSNINSSSI
jgi:hypothetical protein